VDSQIKHSIAFAPHMGLPLSVNGQLNMKCRWRMRGPWKTGIANTFHMWCLFKQFDYIYFANCLSWKYLNLILFPPQMKCLTRIYFASYILSPFLSLPSDEDTCILPSTCFQVGLKCTAVYLWIDCLVFGLSMHIFPHKCYSLNYLSFINLSGWHLWTKLKPSCSTKGWEFLESWDFWHLKMDSARWR
jgi:hypothetical protein